jgi:hypothetical protein
MRNTIWLTSSLCAAIAFSSAGCKHKQASAPAAAPANTGMGSGAPADTHPEATPVGTGSAAGGDNKGDSTNSSP